MRPPPRIPRPSVRAKRVHIRPAPPANHRRRRGPKPPPEAMVDVLAQTPPERRHGVLLLLLGALARHARRGVVQAFTDPSARAAALDAPRPDAPEGWADGLLEAMAAADKRHPNDPELLRAALVYVVGNALNALNATFVEHFARAAGSPGYTWTTRHDSRVRELHNELEGTTHTWDNPPLSGLPDFHGHPGEPAACRCTAWPLPPG